MHEGFAQIALRKVGEEDQELLPDRLVEAEPRDRLRTLGLICIGGEQHIDRVADQEHAEKNQSGHRQDDKETLTDPPDQERQHRILPPDPMVACRGSPTQTIPRALLARNVPLSG